MTVRVNNWIIFLCSRNEHTLVSQLALQLKRITQLVVFWASLSSCPILWWSKSCACDVESSLHKVKCKSPLETSTSIFGYVNPGSYHHFRFWPRIEVAERPILGLQTWVFPDSSHRLNTHQVLLLSHTKLTKVEKEISHIFKDFNLL